MTTWLATHVGRVRSNNEDSLAEDRGLGLIVLADGMGGYNAGEVASGIASSTIIELVRRHRHQLAEPPPGGYQGAEGQLLKLAMETAHERIRMRASLEPDCAGMGTTAIACLLQGDRLWIAHVGDSRVYRWRNKELVQLTQDHSLLEELILRGHYSREDASRLVRKNIVTRALGVEPDVSVDLIQHRNESGDLLLVCSDGLSDMLDDNAVASILLNPNEELPHIAKALIDGALASGGRDNISVALIRVDQIENHGGLRDRILKWRPGKATQPRN